MTFAVGIGTAIGARIAITVGAGAGVATVFEDTEREHLCLEYLIIGVSHLVNIKMCRAQAKMVDLVGLLQGFKLTCVGW